MVKGARCGQHGEIKNIPVPPAVVNERMFCQVDYAMPAGEALTRCQPVPRILLFFQAEN